MTSDLGPAGPLLVAALAIVVIAISWPLTSELWGISMNIVAIVIIALGGLMGAANG